MPNKIDPLKAFDIGVQYNHDTNPNDPAWSPDEIKAIRAALQRDKDRK